MQEIKNITKIEVKSTKVLARQQVEHAKQGVRQWKVWLMEVLI